MTVLARTPSVDYLASKIHVAIFDILRQEYPFVSAEDAGNAIALGSQGALHDVTRNMRATSAEGAREQGDPAPSSAPAEADQAVSAS